MINRSNQSLIYFVASIINKYIPFVNMHIRNVQFQTVVFSDYIVFSWNLPSINPYQATADFGVIFQIGLNDGTR